MEGLPLLPIACPSWVKPGTVAENAAFLADRVAEIGLCCFEWQSSATMSEAELPESLVALSGLSGQSPMRWHVHLPTDVSPDSGLAAAQSALSVWDRVAFLNPRIAVLHLPPFAHGAGLTWLHDFISAWTQRGLAPERLAIENVRGASPRDYGPALWQLGLSFCLDVGHALAYAHEDMWSGDSFSIQCLQRLRLTHWSAPGTPKPGTPPSDKHLALTEWTPAQKKSTLRAARLITQIQNSQLHARKHDDTVMIEVFDWDKVLQSWPVLQELGMFSAKA